MTAPVPSHLEKRLLRGLRILADAEQRGRTLSARWLGLELGMAENAGIETRQRLLAMGLLLPLPSRRGGVQRVKVSDEGWRALDEAPPADPVAAPPLLRLCLRCDGLFPSEGAHNRICSACKGSDAWRDASPLAAPVNRPARGGRHA